MRVLYVDNIASHYREAIFRLMDKEYQIDYVFGQSYDDIKEMDTSFLRGRVEKRKLIKIFGGYWQPGVIRKLFDHYDAYLLIGETRAWSTWVFGIMANCLFKSKHLYFWTHGWYGKETKFEVFLKKIFFHLPKGGIFLYGDYARQLMIQNGFDGNKLYPIHNSLNYEEQNKVRNRIAPSNIYNNHFQNSNKTIILIGRLNKRKKIPLLLEAIYKLNNEGKFYNVVFVGDGSERTGLERMTLDLGLQGQVWFYGACYDELKNAELIYNADLCVTPGDVGLTAIHVLTFGTPCITHNCFKYQGPEFEVIKAGVTGDFYEYDNSASLKDCIDAWFDNHSDRIKTREACYKEIEHGWTPKYQIEVLKEHIK